MPKHKTIHVRVRDTDNVIFEGEVDRISSFNEAGPFDIYPMHANFISIIRKNLILYLNKKKVKELTLEQAVIKVKKDQAHIYLGIEALISEESIVKTNNTLKSSEPNQPK